MGGPTPELDVSDLDRSLAFYVLGFAVMFAAGPGRRFRTAPLEHPYGRGVNFMIEVAEIDRLHSRVQAAGFTIVIPLEERWYRQNEVEYGRKQFVVADPDGYLLRFSTSLGQSPLSNKFPPTVRG